MDLLAHPGDALQTFVFMLLVKEGMAFAPRVEVQRTGVFTPPIQLIGAPGVDFRALVVLAAVRFLGPPHQLVDLGGQRLLLEIGLGAGTFGCLLAGLGHPVGALLACLGAGFDPLAGDLGRQIAPGEAVGEGADGDFSPVEIAFRASVVAIGQFLVAVGDQGTDADRCFLGPDILQGPRPVGCHLHPVVALAEDRQHIFPQALGVGIGRIQADGGIDLVPGFGEVRLAVERKGFGVGRLGLDLLLAGRYGRRRRNRSGGRIGLVFSRPQVRSDRPRHGQGQHHGGERKAAMAAHDDS